MNFTFCEQFDVSMKLHKPLVPICLMANMPCVEPEIAITLWFVKPRNGSRKAA